LDITYKLARDLQNIYVLFEVEDDTAAVLGRGDYSDEGFWAVDNVELFFDMDNGKDVWSGSGGAAYDDNDFQLRIHRDTIVELTADDWPNVLGKIPTIPNAPNSESPVYGQDHLGGLPGLGIELELVETANGYFQEIAIPINFLTAADPELSIGDFIDETVIGFRAQVRDMDAVGVDMMETFPEGSHWKDPSSWANMILEAVPAPSMIVVDGVIDDVWSKAPEFEISTIVEPEKHAPWSVENEADLSGYFKVLWDVKNLYVMGVISDDTLVYTDASHIADKFNIYLDPENEKNVLDPGLISVVATFGTDNAKSGRVQPGWGNPPYYEYVMEPNDTGYVVEFLIPVDSIRNPVMSAGTMMGIDIMLNDVDDPVAADRDLKAWNTSYDFLYRDAFRFGTIELNADSTVTAYTSPDPPSTFAATLTGDMLNDVELTWEESANAEGYRVISFYGSNTDPAIFEAEVTGGSTTTVTVEDLEPGFYTYYLVSNATGDVMSMPEENEVSFEVLNWETEITAFDFADVDEISVDITTDSVMVMVPQGTDLGALTPTVTVSTGASVSPESGAAQDFTSDVTYTVTAENGVTTKDYTVVVKTNVGISPAFVNAFKVYPNPASDVLNVEGYKVKTIEIVDLTGKKMAVKEFGRPVEFGTMDVSTLKGGLYLVKIKSTEGEIIKPVLKK
jgi:hypothetical protein